MTGPPRRTEGHRDWLTALGLSAGPLAAIGLARFAYSLLLPAMRAELRWSYAEAGAMNTANAVGYLVGAVLAAPLLRHTGVRPAFAPTVAVTAGAVLACAATGQFPVLLGLRLLAGAAGAVAFVAGAGLAAHAGAHLPPRRAAVLIGVYVGGGGWGIVLSGLSVAPVLSALGPAEGWRAGWLVLGLVAALATVPALLAGRRVPEPAGAPRPGPAGGGWPRRRLIPTVVAYALFGAGYIAYLTFVVALLRTRGLSAAQVGLFWVLLGVAAGTGFWWGGVLGKARGGRGLALLLAVLAAGAALPLVTTGALAAYGSAVLFGGSVLSTAAAVTVIARASLPAHQWNAAIAELTAVFAAGQCVGPVLAGALSDRFGGLRAGLGLSVGLLLLGAAVAVSQPDRAWGRRSPAPEKAPRRRRPAA